MKQTEGMVMLAVLGALAGCAANPVTTHNQVGFDQTVRYGTIKDHLDLPGGDAVDLQQIQGQYALKLKSQMRAIPIPGVVAAKIIRGDMVNDRMVIILEKATQSCPQSTQVFSIKGNELLSWDIGDCWNRPLINLHNSIETFDFIRQGKIERMAYYDGRMIKVNTQTAAPATAPAIPTGQPTPSDSTGPASAARPHYQPGLPVTPNQADLASARQSLPAQTTPSQTELADHSKTPAARPEKAVVPAKPAALALPTGIEQKPITIILDK